MKYVTPFLFAAFCLSPLAGFAADDFGSRFTEDAPSAFSDPIDGSGFADIAPAAGDNVDDVDSEEKPQILNNEPVDDLDSEQSSDDGIISF